MQLATARGHVKTARFLLEVGADKCQLMTTATAPLFMAADRGHLDMARFLVEVGFDKDRTNLQGATPLMTAAWAGRVDIVRFLVDSGANHRHTMHDGRTALDVASERGHTQVVRFLSELAEEGEEKKASWSTLGPGNSWIFLIFSNDFHISPPCFFWLMGIPPSPPSPTFRLRSHGTRRCREGLRDE